MNRRRTQEGPSTTPGGFREMVGWTVRKWEKDYAELALTVGPSHINRANVVHGGVLMALLDSVCGYAGCWAERPEDARMCVTLSWSTNFVAAARHGASLIARGRVRGGGRRIFAGSAEIVDAEGNLIATGEGMFRYVDGR